MHGQHGSKYSKVVVAVLLLFGSALTTLAQAQGAVAASAVPTALPSAAPRLSAGLAPIPTPTATVRALPTATAHRRAGRCGDLGGVVENRSCAVGLELTGAVTNRSRTDNPGPPVAFARRCRAVSSIPQAVSRPEARQTPVVTTGQTPSSHGPCGAGATRGRAYAGSIQRGR